MSYSRVSKSWANSFADAGMALLVLNIMFWAFVIQAALGALIGVIGGYFLALGTSLIVFVTTQMPLSTECWELLCGRLTTVGAIVGAVTIPVFWYLVKREMILPLREWPAAIWSAIRGRRNRRV